MRNLRLTIAYDGTRYVGWQIQSNGLAVQEVIERAIEKLTGTRTRLIGAGRTDSGVHALGQVANFWTDSTISAESLPYALQFLLPDDVVILRAEDVGPGFHSTYSAVSKRYRYVIYNSDVRNPFVRNYACRFRKQLDVAAMQEAAQVLVGTHDFACFESQSSPRSTTVRTIMELSVDRHAGWPVWTQQASLQAPPAPDGSFVWMDIVADGFLYNMVRAIAGTLLKVGVHSWNAEDVRSILTSRDRNRAGKTAPAHGLYLVRVEYGEGTTSAAG